MPNISTPTPPGKMYYFTNQPQEQRFQNTPKQLMMSNKEFYQQPVPPQSRSTRPFETSSYQSPSLEEGMSHLGSRALNRQSKDFKPKSLQMQEYLKNESLALPMEFNEILITTLNMTGTDQIQKNALKLETQINEEYIQPMAHSIVISRVIESDEKRIEFLSNFFHWMTNKNIIKTFINEWIEAILKIIINESIAPRSKVDNSKLASPSIKNISTFLGYLTLAHNKPLLQENIDLKQLLLEAYEKKCIDIAILVVWKILRTGEKSKIFTPNNPWMSGMHSLLFEYLQNYIKNNPQADRSLDKEIQIVLKTRSQMPNWIIESTLFRDYDNKNYKNNELIYLTQLIANDPLIVAPKLLTGISETSESKQLEKDSQNNMLNISDVETSLETIKITETSKKFPSINQEYLKMLISKAIDIAFKEIKEPVIKRVVPITLITTRTMILKDFALDPDPERMKLAAKYTSKSLSGMLAQITCKEPFKQHLSKNLKDQIYSSTEPSITMLSEEEKRNLIDIIRNENIEIGWNKVRLDIQREAIIGISKENSILEAIKQREAALSTGKLFRDYSNMENFNKLPDLLKPSENGLTEDEFQLYTDFDTIPYYDIESEVIKNTEMIIQDEDEKQSENDIAKIKEKIIRDKLQLLWQSYLNWEGKMAETNAVVKKNIAELQAMISGVPNGQVIITEEFMKQRKKVSMNAHLTVLLIEHNIISLSLWQEKFSVSFLSPQDESKEFIEFLEIFIIHGAIEKWIITKENIPDIISSIEMQFKNDYDDELLVQWKWILDLFDISDPFSQNYDEIAVVYYDQWVNSSDISSITNKFLYKLSVIFKNSQNIIMFFKLALERSLELTESETKTEVIQDFNYIDKFIHLAILWGLTWLPQSPQRLYNIIDEEQILKVVWEILEEHHSEKLIEFNQIPFWRIFTSFLRQYYITFKSVHESENIDIIRK